MTLPGAEAAHVLHGLVGHDVGIDIAVGSADAGWRNLALVVGLFEHCDAGPFGCDLRVGRDLVTVEMTSLLRADRRVNPRGDDVYAMVFPHMLVDVWLYVPD
jgi:hypothetical protein